MFKYPALIHKDSKSDYGVSFPDFPGCVTAGSSFEEACFMAEEALQFHIEGLIEDKEVIPDPTSLDIVHRIASKEKALLTIVSVRIQRKLKRINITIDEGILEKADIAAEFSGMNRSAFISEALRHLIEMRKDKLLKTN